MTRGFVNTVFAYLKLVKSAEKIQEIILGLRYRRYEKI